MRQRVDAFDHMARAKSFQFAFAHGAAADVATRDHSKSCIVGCRACIGQQHRAAGQRSVVLRMADLESRDGSKSRRHASILAGSTGFWLVSLPPCLPGT